MKKDALSSKIDQIDLKILKELDENCRQSLNVIGKKVRLSKEAVSKRISKLEKENVILGYHAVIDPSAIGYRFHRFYLKFQGTGREDEMRILGYIQSLPQTWFLGRISEKYDASWMVLYRSQEELHELWDAFTWKFARFLLSVESAPYYEAIHYPYPFPNAAKRNALVVGGKDGAVKVDEKDVRILAAFATDGRIRFTTLASKVGLNPLSLKKRTERLKDEGVILGFRPTIDFAKFGWEYRKLDVFLSDKKAENLSLSVIQSHPNLVYIDKTIGSADIEAEFFIEPDEFESLLSELKDKCGSMLRTYDSFRITQVLTLRYF
jgi:Lrp/AsnC family leucine-responsive transcriptional regulator